MSGALFGLPIIRDPSDPATLYLLHPRPLPSLSSLDWLPLYVPDLVDFKVRFRAQDIPRPIYVTTFGLDGLGRDEWRSRRAVDWRLNWYRDPGSAWWER